MLHFLRSVVDGLAAVSVLVSCATYYLAARKLWRHRHERTVASSISIASNGLYFVTTTFFALNMVLTTAPWQTMVETAMSLLDTTFLMAVGLSIWIPEERAKGLRRLLVESLRLERDGLVPSRRVIAIGERGAQAQTCESSGEREGPKRAETENEVGAAMPRGGEVTCSRILLP